MINPTFCIFHCNNLVELFQLIYWAVFSNRYWEVLDTSNVGWELKLEVTGLTDDEDYQKTIQLAAASNWQLWVGQGMRTAWYFPINLKDVIDG